MVIATYETSDKSTVPNIAAAVETQHATIGMLFPDYKEFGASSVVIPTRLMEPAFGCLFAYPHIVHKLSLVWGTPEASDVIEHMKLQDRDEFRAGFPPSVLFALQDLQDANNKLLMR